MSESFDRIGLPAGDSPCSLVGSSPPAHWSALPSTLPQRRHCARALWRPVEAKAIVTVALAFRAMRASARRHRRRQKRASRLPRNWGKSPAGSRCRWRRRSGPRRTAPRAAVNAVLLLRGPAASARHGPLLPLLRCSSAAETGATRSKRQTEWAVSSICAALAQRGEGGASHHDRASLRDRQPRMEFSIERSIFGRCGVMRLTSPSRGCTFGVEGTPPRGVGLCRFLRRCWS